MFCKSPSLSSTYSYSYLSDTFMEPTNLLLLGILNLHFVSVLCRENGPDDVTIKILYCGVCHSDLHSAKNEWGFTRYPLVPGYAIYLIFRTIILLPIIVCLNILNCHVYNVSLIVRMLLCFVPMIEVVCY